MTFAERLTGAVEHGHLCVGLDPVPEKMPDLFQGRKQGVAEFVEAIVRATAPYAAAYKPNLAFFEALGREGDEALERAIATVREAAPHAVLIGDAKRGDIGSTAQRYAVALFDRWGFDAATVNPYLGADSVVPFVERPDKGVYILALTSNPSAVQVQHVGGDRPLFLRVAELAQTEWNGNRNVGLVVGATKPEQMADVRTAAPNLPWLIPGIGAQGGDLPAAVRFGMGPLGLPSLINASRSIIYASKGDDFAEAAAREAGVLREKILQG